MAYCPKCKTEYRDGIETCADCGAALVEKLPHDGAEPLYRIRSEELFRKFTAYLDYCGLPYETDFTEADGTYELYSVKSRYNMKITQAFETVVSAEAEQELLNIASDSVNADGSLSPEEAGELSDLVSEKLASAGESELSEESFNELIREEAVSKLQGTEFHRLKSYEPLRKKAEESRSSGIMLLVFSVLGAAFVVLNMTGVISLFGALFTQLVLLGFFLLLFIAGIWSLFGAKKDLILAEDEEKNIEHLNSWLKENITRDMLSDPDEADFSDEEKQLNEQERLYKLAEAEFPDLSEEILNHFTDEFYTSNFLSDSPESNLE